MKPRKYLMISALSKQMEEIKERIKNEVGKFDIEHPCLMICENEYKNTCNNYGWANKKEIIGYHPTYAIPEDIALEVLKFYKELQVMKSDEIYGAVLKKLLNEAKDMEGGKEK